ncbi:MAG: hypothetical protein QMC36_08905 [Patescibacteria group bacterium]
MANFTPFFTHLATASALVAPQSDIVVWKWRSALSITAFAEVFESLRMGLDGYRMWVVRRPDIRIISTSRIKSQDSDKYEISNPPRFPFFFFSKGIYSI